MKINSKKYQFAFLLLTLVSAFNLSAQSAAELYEQQQISTHQIDKENWKKHTKEINYDQSSFEKTKQKEAEAESDRAKSKGDNPAFEVEVNPGPTSFETTFGPLFKFLLIATGIALLVFLIMKLMNAEQLFSPKNKKISSAATAIDLEDIEENLHESDLEGFIRQALADKNYALAVRLYYLAILKELSLSKQIKWKRDKTNREYLREMSGQKLATKFKETTLIFERVWYGTGELTAPVFQELEPKFKMVLKEAGRT